MSIFGTSKDSNGNVKFGTFWQVDAQNRANQVSDYRNKLAEYGDALLGGKTQDALKATSNFSAGLKGLGNISKSVGASLANGAIAAWIIDTDYLHCKNGILLIVQITNREKRYYTQLAIQAKKCYTEDGEVSACVCARRRRHEHAEAARRH